jgi:hypothetical protein
VIPVVTRGRVMTLSLLIDSATIVFVFGTVDWNSMNPIFPEELKNYGKKSP